MSLYLVVKSGHVVAVIAWAGAMIVAPLLLHPADGTPRALRLARLADARRVVRRVAMPAMLATWSFGIALVTLGHWLPSIWLVAKLVFVLVLSGLHGVLSGRLRQLSGDPAPDPPAWMRRLSTASIALVAAIVVLVIAKPF